MPPPPATTEPASEASPEKPSVEFELRKPTEEEMSASIMSEQDFVDIARIMPGAISQPAPVPAPPKAAPPVAPQPAEAATPAATPTAQTAPEVLVLDEQDGEPLVGFWDGLTVGEFLSGWAGDPSDPACRSIKVSLCVDAFEQLAAEGVKARVVSMPSWELFERQEKGYRDSVLPPAVKARVAVEQASPFGWARYVGADGATIAMTSFGASAPLKDLLKKFGFTVENVVAAAKQQIALYGEGKRAKPSSGRKAQARRAPRRSPAPRKAAGSAPRKAAGRGGKRRR